MLIFEAEEYFIAKLDFRRLIGQKLFVTNSIQLLTNVSVPTILFLVPSPSPFPDSQSEPNPAYEPNC